MKYFSRTNARGDTIVEVMIVLAILGTAISIAYATANRSLLITRAAHESSVAAYILQSQLEAVRAMASVSDPSDLSTNVFLAPETTEFCITVDPMSGKNVVSRTIDNPPPCIQKTIYTIAITRTTVSGQNDTFTLKATWDDVSGQGQDTATLSYKVYTKS